MRNTNNTGLPPAQGLYRPEFEHDSCGVGFVANIKGKRSHQIILDADHLLCRMDHRGARGAEPNTGDGAGMLTALPHEFLAKVAKQEFGATLPAPGKFAAGIVFLPQDPAERERCKKVVAEICAAQKQTLVGWRVVPINVAAADVGNSALDAAPFIEQLFVAAGVGCEGDAFERALYMLRKRASHLLRGDKTLTQAKLFYICSLSSKIVIYKGMLTPGQLLHFYTDLRDPDYTTHLAMVHSRFSTNTFPSWDRAQPNRFMAHNGEINTLRGNENWMRARQGVVASDLYGDSLKSLFPIGEPDCSDSGVFDNVLEFLLMTGRTLQESIMMMIPEAWQKNELDAREQAGVLRVPLVPHGAVGRPRVDRVHRRQVHRRRARSQRPAPEPLLPDHRRPRDHGQRSRRRADRPRPREGQGPARAGPHVPDRLRARPARARRRAQERVREPPALRRVARGEPHRIA